MPKNAQRNARGKLGRLALVLGLLLGLGGNAAKAAGVELLTQEPDPHGFPRPARGSRDVPLRTSLYFELGLSQDAARGDEVDSESVAVIIQETGGRAVELMGPGRKFAPGVTGWTRPRQSLSGAASLAVYLEAPAPLHPSTTYEMRVAARSRAGAVLATNEGRAWTFTTETNAGLRGLEFALDFKKEPVRWHGAFFSGFCNVLFCSDNATFGPTYELMDQARKEHPRAWSYQRDFWMTGTEFQPQAFLPPRPPNIVRERETRRIVSMEKRTNGVLLRVEDVFGHEQYGVPANRPLSEDYHKTDEILVADGVSDAKGVVLAVSEPAGTILVGPLADPPGGWKIAYSGALPDRENPDAPGLFPPGGCYLRKLNPSGTPCYFWGRLDKEWDLARRRHGRRVLVNFADAAGDLARDGRSWTTVKDYAEWHEVALAIAGHILDRYGADALGFTWSVFNEPDLGGLFWRADWTELQTFYDDTTDAILRAAEDRGYDSRQMFVGGLELGGIFGVNLRLTEFLAHCSPRAGAAGALPMNAAYADHRLDGKRSRRVESLCAAHGGKGSPCDFVSIHSYNRAEIMAAKLIRAKEIALEIDPDYYGDLWVNSHESCPDWMPPPDLAAADSYLGNGYFPTWCADVIHRQLLRAEGDIRFARGETILTVFPPNQNFGGMPAFTRLIHCDDNGDGRESRAVTIPMPIFHVLGLLADMGPSYWALPGRRVGGHVVGGFASREGSVARALVYAHGAQDTQSRSESEFDVTLEVGGLDPGEMSVREYRFDRDHNSYFQAGRELRDRPDAKTNATAAVMTPRTYSRAEVDKIQKLSECCPTRTGTVVVNSSGRLEWKLHLEGNGLGFVICEPRAQKSVGN